MLYVKNGHNTFISYKNFKSSSCYAVFFKYNNLSYEKV